MKSNEDSTLIANFNRSLICMIDFCFSLPWIGSSLELEIYQGRDYMSYGITIISLKLNLEIHRKISNNIR